MYLPFISIEVVVANNNFLTYACWNTCLLIKIFIEIERNTVSEFYTTVNNVEIYKCQKCLKSKI